MKGEKRNLELGSPYYHSVLSIAFQISFYEILSSVFSCRGLAQK